MKVKVWWNPYSNRWNAQKRWPAVAAVLKSAGVDFDLSVSEHPEHLVGLAAESVKQGFSTIVIVGGFDQSPPAHADSGWFNHWLTDFDYEIFPRTVPVLVK